MCPLVRTVDVVVFIEDKSNVLVPFGHVDPPRKQVRTINVIVVKEADVLSSCVRRREVRVSRHA
jgi:hypothetical protein